MAILIELDNVKSNKSKRKSVKKDHRDQRFASECMSKEKTLHLIDRLTPVVNIIEKLLDGWQLRLRVDGLLAVACVPTRITLTARAVTVATAIA